MTAPLQGRRVEPLAAAEIERIAAEIERLGLKRNARRLRALLADEVEDERVFPVQDSGRQVVGIPWGLAELLYPAYGSGQSLERLAERGGFGVGELGQLAADCYCSGSRRSPKLARPPLLDLYDAARGAAQQSATHAHEASFGLPGLPSIVGLVARDEPEEGRS